MTVTLLAISGSPNRHGNTETLLDAFLEGAGGAGAACEKVVISTLKFRSCTGCNACHKTGACVVRDDFTPLLEKMMEADILVLASPIYSMGITAELKALIDRGQVFWARKFLLKDLDFSKEHIRQHKGVFISTAGQDNDRVFDGAYPVITALFNDCGFEYYANIAINRMDMHGGIRGHPTALGDARKKGEEVVKTVSELRALPESVL